MLTLNYVLEALTGSPIDLSRLVITEATVDLRQVIPGAMFVALPGERTDGHSFVEEAFKNGASIALVQRNMPAEFVTLDLSRVPLIPDTTLPTALRSGQPFCIKVANTLTALQTIAAFWRRKLDLRVIGITGSVGKSTTKELIFEVLSQRYRTLKNPGNQNNEIGLPLAILRLGYGYQRAVLEMGFYVPGEIAQLCEIAQPYTGVVTNIGTVHAERAGSQEDIARGKAELVQALPAGGNAILNFDDPLVRAMAEKTRAHVLFYGLDPSAHLWADEVESFGLEGIRFRLHYKRETLSIRVPMIGRHSVHTALRAAAVGMVEGLPWGSCAGARTTPSSPARRVWARPPSSKALRSASPLGTSRRPSRRCHCAPWMWGCSRPAPA